MIGIADTAAGLEDFAVVVGIDTYHDRSLPPLRGAADDAKRFAKWLRGPSCHERLQRRQIIKQLSVATTTHLKEAFTKLHEVPKGRRLYIFVSGHGNGESLKDAFVYTTDYRPHFDDYWDFVRIAEAWRYSGRFEEVVLFMDCCRVVTQGGKGRHISLTIEEGRPAKHFYCFACLVDGRAREITIGGRARGEFTLRLIRALRGFEQRAMDQNGQVTAHSLARYLETLSALKPDIDPREGAHLPDLILSKGFTSETRPLTIQLSQPGEGFALFSGQQGFGFRRLEWRSKQTGPNTFVVRRHVAEGVIAVAVPDVPEWSQAKKLIPVPLECSAIDI